MTDQRMPDQPNLPEGVRELVWRGRQFYAFAPYALRYADTLEPIEDDLPDDTRLVLSEDLPAIRAAAVEEERERIEAKITETAGWPVARNHFHRALAALDSDSEGESGV